MLYKNRSRKSIILYSISGVKNVVHKNELVESNLYPEVISSIDFIPYIEEPKPIEDPKYQEEDNRIGLLKSDVVVLSGKFAMLEKQLIDLKDFFIKEIGKIKIESVEETPLLTQKEPKKNPKRNIK